VRNEKQETFIEEYCLTGNAAKSAIKAGYSAKIAKQRGYKLKEQFSREIEERSKKMLRDCVPGALAQLKNLSDSAISEAVKLGAIKDILDRAGYKPVERIDQIISHADKSTQELERELEALIGVTQVEEIPELVN
jgi:phage terminase small subunit